jgi:hypothetical protein
MADLNLSQAEADALIAMEKHRLSEASHAFPLSGGSLSLPLQSADRRESFLLDVSRGRIDMAKVKMQNRARLIVVLVRLDLAGPPHRNPDDEEIPSPHLHLFREGFGDKWATPVPMERFSRLGDLWGTLDDFMQFCNITQPPVIERGLFV